MLPITLFRVGRGKYLNIRPHASFDDRHIELCTLNESYELVKSWDQADYLKVRE